MDLPFQDTHWTIVNGESVSSVNNNVWTYVAVSVSRGGALKVFVNGVLEVSISAPSSCDITNNGVNFYIGSYVTDAGDQFLGDIDELRVYNRALSNAETVSNMFVSSLDNVAIGGAYFTGSAINGGGTGYIVDKCSLSSATPT
eukprot:gene36742-45324_t